MSKKPNIFCAVAKSISELSSKLTRALSKRERESLTDPSAPVFNDGKKELTLRGDDLALQFQHIVDKYVDSHYPLRS